MWRGARVSSNSVSVVHTRGVQRLRLSGKFQIICWLSHFLHLLFVHQILVNFGGIKLRLWVFNHLFKTLFDIKSHLFALPSGLLCEFPASQRVSRIRRCCISCHIPLHSFHRWGLFISCKTSFILLSHINSVRLICLFFRFMLTESTSGRWARGWIGPWSCEFLQTFCDRAIVLILNWRDPSEHWLVCLGRATCECMLLCCRGRSLEFELMATWREICSSIRVQASWSHLILWYFYLI